MEDPYHRYEKTLAAISESHRDVWRENSKRIFHLSDEQIIFALECALEECYDDSCGSLEDPALELGQELIRRYNKKKRECEILDKSNKEFPLELFQEVQEENKKLKKECEELKRNIETLEYEVAAWIDQTGN